MAGIYNGEKILSIAVDTGFGETKVLVNGIFFRFPSQVVDITGSENAYISDKKKNYIRTNMIEGRTHVVGSFAVTELSERHKREEKSLRNLVDNSYEHFKTEEYRITLMTAVGMAIIKYAIYTKTKKISPAIPIAKDGTLDLSEWQVFIAVALPHGIAQDVWGTVKSALTRQHNFSIETNDGIFHLDFTLTDTNCMCLSQAVAALIGAITDDNGAELPDSEIVKNLPALVIDGGYVTIGEFKFTSHKKVSDDAESVSNYAMFNINSRVAEVLAERYNRSDIHEFNIERIFEEIMEAEEEAAREGGEARNIFVAYGEDGSTDYVPNTEIMKIKADAIRETFEAYMDHLNNKYENLVSIRQIICTGGTGAVYYPYIKEYCEKYKKHLANHVYLTTYEFQGMKVEPQYAIAVGLYKSLRSEIMRAIKREEARRKKQQQ